MSGQPPAFLEPQFIFFILMLVVMFLVVIRPQMKAKKEHASLLAKLDKNDEVVTSGGMHGTIISVGEKTVVLRIADNVKVEFDKNSIAVVTKSR